MSPAFPAESDFQRALVARLAELRVANHTSQGTLAAELGLDQAAVSRVESGQRRLSVGETFAWFEALNLTASEAAEMLRELWLAHGSRPPGFWTDVHDH